jgi:hypothetical protein
MNFTTTYVLYALLLLLIVVLGVVLWLGPGTYDTSSYLFPSLNPKDNAAEWQKFDRVEIQRGGDKIEFVRADNKQDWTVNGYRANAGAVNELVRSVASARREKHIEKPANLADWGLDKPRAVVVLKNSADPRAEVKLTVGGDSIGSAPGRGTLYVQSSERGGEPLAVLKTVLQGVLGDQNSFRDRDLLAPNSARIEKVKLSEGDAVVALHKKDEDTWVFTKPFEGDAEARGGLAEPAPDRPIKTVAELLDDLAALKVGYASEKDNDFVADDVGDFARYNLGPKDPVLRLQVTRDETPDAPPPTPGNPKPEKPEKKTADVALLVGVGKAVGPKSDRYYARLEGEKSVFRVPVKTVERLRALLKPPAAEALRDHRLVRFRNFATPDVIQIEKENSADALDFRRKGGEDAWKLYRGDTALDVDAAAVRGLLALLTQPYEKMRFPDPKDEAALGLKDPKKARAVVSLWVEGVEEDKKDDKKDKDKDKDKDKGKAEAEKKPTKPALKADRKGKPTVKLTFGEKVTVAGGEELVAVKREVEGEGTTLLEVPLLVLDRVKEGPLFFADKKLPQFNPRLLGATGVSRLKLERDGKEYDVVRSRRFALALGLYVFWRGGQAFELAGEREREPWKFEKPDDLAGRDADEAAVSAILTALNSLQADRLIAERANDAELESYGLLKSRLRATVTVTDGATQVPYIYEFGKELPTNTEMVYARQVFPKDKGGRDMIFAVAKLSIRPLEQDLLDLTLFRFEPTDVRTLTIKGWRNLDMGAKTVTVEQFKSSDGLRWETDLFKVDNGRTLGLLGLLGQLRADVAVARNPAELNRAWGLDPSVNDQITEFEITLADGRQLKLTVGNGGSTPDGRIGYYAVTNRTGKDVFLISQQMFRELKQDRYYLQAH